MKLLFENWRQYLTEASNPLERLRGHLISLHELYEAEDYDKLTDIMESPTELQKMMQMIGDADEYLTDKRLPEHQYENSAQAILQAENEVMHLADGGYSRLTASFLQPPHLWIDEGVSNPKVVERFNEYMADLIE
jgi:prephenate dehydrogenase